MERYYTVKEVATMLKKNPETIRRWCRDGVLKCSKLGESKNSGLLVSGKEVTRAKSLLIDQKQLRRFLSEE